MCWLANNIIMVLCMMDFYQDTITDSYNHDYCMKNNFQIKLFITKTFEH
jgi:hypothetical protein